MAIKSNIRLFQLKFSSLIEDDLRDSKANGLVTIKSEEDLIVFLVTKQSIYVFNSINSDCRKFLSKQLKSEDFTICTTDGCFDALRLKKHMNIILGGREGKILDLPTLHSQLEIRETMVRKVTSRTETLTSEYIAKNIKLRRLGYEDLVKKYLAKYTKMELTQDVINVIETLPAPEKETAMNNLALVSFARELAIEMLARVQRQKSQVSQSMIAMSRASSELRHRYETHHKDTNSYDTLAHYVAELPPK